MKYKLTLKLITFRYYEEQLTFKHLNVKPI